MGELPYPVCVCPLVLRAEFDLNTSHVFLQGVLVAVSLVGGGAGDARAWLEPGVSQNFPFARWPS